MRVLLAVHHYLDEQTGVAGVTRSLGAALTSLGCTVTYFGYEHAYAVRKPSIWQQIRFPWQLAGYLRRKRGQFDVVDVTLADAWVWLLARRLIGDALPAVVTRSHGLEHLADQRARLAVKRGVEKLTFKYPFYHGGYRLWEATRSLRMADGNLFLNHAEIEYVTQELGLDPAKLRMIPNGVGEHFFHGTPNLDDNAGPLRLCYVGNWQPSKGSTAIVEALTRLDMEFTVTLLGGIRPPDSILGDFPESLRPRVRVVSRYRNPELPALLDGQQVLVFVSRSEGFSLALIEAMSRGLVPICTPVGGAPFVIREGQTGFLVPVDDTESLVKAIRRLDTDRDLLGRMRHAAVERARDFSWPGLAQQTMEVYAAALQRRRGKSD